LNQHLFKTTLELAQISTKIKHRCWAKIGTSVVVGKPDGLPGLPQGPHVGIRCPGHLHPPSTAPEKRPWFFCGENVKKNNLWIRWFKDV